MAAESIALAIALGTTVGTLTLGSVWWLFRKVQQIPGLARVEVKVFGIQIVIDLYPVDRQNKTKPVKRN